MTKLDMLTLACPDCGSVRAFENLHPGDAGCPDEPGRPCPEWICTSCGAGLLVGQTPAPAPAAAAGPSLQRQVA
jgi:hypothetical protein